MLIAAAIVVCATSVVAMSGPMAASVGVVVTVVAAASAATSTVSVVVVTAAVVPVVAVYAVAVAFVSRVLKMRVIDDVAPTHVSMTRSRIGSLSSSCRNSCNASACAPRGAGNTTVAMAVGTSVSGCGGARTNGRTSCPQ